MTVCYPPNWSSLRYPWVRAELLDYLAELGDPSATAKWLKPDPQGPIIGIDQTFHFFFDDYDFSAGQIGYSLFDEEEVAAIASVKQALEAIFTTNKAGDDRYFLEHPQWAPVVSAAVRAHAKLSTKGVLSG